MTVLLADAQITAIPAHDNGEHVVDLAEWGVATVVEDGPGRRVRSSLAQRLQRAQTRLPNGLLLLVAEGYRSPRDQARIITSYTRALSLEMPHLDEPSLRRLASRFVAPLEVAPHVAGAAVDITLAHETGESLWMGTPIDATPEQSENACVFDARNISTEARANRDLLASVLSAEGFVNYPTEWWHWSYGDRYWAHVSGASSAIYGPVDSVDAA